MQPNPDFQKLPKAFWATVKLVSEHLGYSVRRARGAEPTIRRYSPADVLATATSRGLNAKELTKLNWHEILAAYSSFRADILQDYVRPRLMKLEEAKRLYEKLYPSQSWSCALPQNKQKGPKAHPNYLGCLVNMLAEEALAGKSFDSAPGGLVTVTKKGLPLRTLARRYDGAYPTINNPVAVWEVKEYYGTTTFGSRVADGVYETMLDGVELLELREVEGVVIRHYLFADDWFTWWSMGRSYLCRMIDMLHDDLVDEVFFGREVVERWPDVVRSWTSPGK